MEIKQAYIGDYERVKKIKLVAKSHERKLNRTLKPMAQNKGRYLSYLKSDLASTDRAVFIAIDNDNVIGIITGRIHNTLSIRSYLRQGHISNLFVEAAYRKKDVATALIKALLKWFKDNKIKDVHLGVFPQNKAAIKAFRSFGFQDYVINMKKSLRL